MVMKLFLATVASSLGMVSVGLFFGWASPSLPKLLRPDSPVRLTLDQSAWVASMITLGGSVGGGICVFLVNNFGRKKTMLLSVVPSIIGWLMIAFATTAWELYISRLLSGVGLTTMYVVFPMYLGEIAPAHARGTLTAMLTVAAKTGQLLEYSMGPFLSVRNLALVSLTLPIVFLATCIWLPESPYHLMRRGNKEEATRSLVAFRGTENVGEELRRIEQSVKADLHNESGPKELLTVRSNYRALIIIMVLIVVQQMSGSQVVVSYAQMIFDAGHTKIEGMYLTMILGAVQVASAIACSIIVDHCGRKPLLIISTFGAFLSMFSIGLYFYLQRAQVDTGRIYWLPAAGVIMYIVFFSIGLGTLPFTLMSELFPTNVKALGNTAAMILCNMTAFIMTRTYHDIVTALGMHMAFWIFATCCAIGLVFVIFFVPETKGKTLQEIQLQMQERILVPICNCGKDSKKESVTEVKSI
ncbi:hypothetical protein KM043_016669 [Ampulex compressa]|nr:hypothetical protein KM043_016669 [Ampulex compressa]